MKNYKVVRIFIDTKDEQRNNIIVLIAMETLRSSS